jgi:hypothetical protein
MKAEILLRIRCPPNALEFICPELLVCCPSKNATYIKFVEDL